MFVNDEMLEIKLKWRQFYKVKNNQGIKCAVESQGLM
jgi:hypothetical protein